MKIVIAIVLSMLVGMTLVEKQAFAEKIPYLTDEEAKVAPFKQLPVDFSLFRKHKALYDEFWKLKENVSVKKSMSKEESMTNLKRRWAILKEITKKEPKFAAGYWLMGDTGVPYGSSYTDEKDLPFARSIFVEVEQANRKCLKIDKENANCTFWLGAAMGKIATIDGVFASLNKGKEILDLFEKAYNSPYNYKIDRGISFKGNASIALGVFYRVIPDFFLLRWFFDISGDLNKSIKYHTKAKEFDGMARLDNTLYLSSVLLCKSGNAPKSKLTKEANKLLDFLVVQTSNSSYYRAVIEGGKHIKKKPTDACGYTIARIQERDEKAFEKRMEKEKADAKKNAS